MRTTMTTTTTTILITIHLYIYHDTFPRPCSCAACIMSFQGKGKGEVYTDRVVHFPSFSGPTIWGFVHSSSSWSSFGNKGAIPSVRLNSSSLSDYFLAIKVCISLFLSFVFQLHCRSLAVTVLSPSSSHSQDNIAVKDMMTISHVLNFVLVIDRMGKKDWRERIFLHSIRSY